MASEPAILQWAAQIRHLSLGTTTLECAGRAKRRRRFGLTTQRRSWISFMISLAPDFSQVGGAIHSLLTVLVYSEKPLKRLINDGYLDHRTEVRC
jgi:hypothetical protein